MINSWIIAYKFQKLSIASVCVWGEGVGDGREKGRASVQVPTRACVPFMAYQELAKFKRL